MYSCNIKIELHAKVTELVVIAQVVLGPYCTLAVGLVQYGPSTTCAINADEGTFE